MGMECNHVSCLSRRYLAEICSGRKDGLWTDGLKSRAFFRDPFLVVTGEKRRGSEEEPLLLRREVMLRNKIQRLFRLFKMAMEGPEDIG